MYYYSLSGRFVILYIDRERHERQARERAAASSPPPEEEPNLDAVRRARIARFHHGAGVG